MFIGHYGVGFLIKKWDNRIPLWLLFLAVQFLDVLWAPFILIGIEKMRIVPGFTASNPFDLYYMPYTHSLAGALFWALLAGLTYYFWKHTSRTTAWLLALAVFSHWILDLIVHQRDLSIYDDTLKVGLGLWNFPMLSLFIEVGFFIGSALFYLYRNHHMSGPERKKMIVLVATLTVIAFLNLVLPAPTLPAFFATEALSSYIIIALVAYWIQKSPRPGTTR